MDKNLVKFNAAEMLKSNEEILDFFADALESQNPAEIAHALDIIAKAKGIEKSYQTPLEVVEGADPMEIVVKVEAREDYSLKLEFKNGEIRVFDMKPFFNQKPFDRLTELSLFMSARVGLGSVVWPGEIDIAPETLYLRSVPI